MNSKNGKFKSRISDNDSNILNNELYEENIGYDIPSTYRINNISEKKK